MKCKCVPNHGKILVQLIFQLCRGLNFTATDNFYYFNNGKRNNDKEEKWERVFRNSVTNNEA